MPPSCAWHLYLQSSPKANSRRLPEDPRSADIGIVTGVKEPPATIPSYSQTVTVLWPALGEEETWAEDGLELAYE